MDLLNPSPIVRLLSRARIPASTHRKHISEEKQNHSDVLRSFMRVQVHGSSEDWPKRKQEPIIDTENITCLSTIVPFKHLSRVSVLGEASLRSSH